MGFSSKKQTTNTQASGTDTSHATSTPNVPDWLSQPYQTSAGQVGQLQHMDPTQFAPQVTGLQSQAFAGAGNLATSPNYGQATGQLNNINYNPSQVSAPTASAGNVTSASLLDGLQNYYTPFKDQVMNPVMNDYDVNSGKTRAAQAAQAASTGAFRGDRYGLREAATEGELSRGRAATEGGLLSDMYGQATSLSGQDAARRQEASTANAGLQTQTSIANAQNGLTASGENAANGINANGQRITGAGLLSTIGQNEGADARANVGTQLGAGTAQQSIQDAIRQYPIQYQQQIQGLLAGLNPELFTGKSVDSNGTSSSTGKSTVTTTPSLMDTAGKVAQMAALFI